MPSHTDGGDLRGGGGGGDVGGGGADGGGGDMWGPWEGDYAACGAGLGVHSGSAAGRPQTPEGPGN